MDKLVVGILAHVDAGKTTLSEGLLYTCGRLKKLGRVDHQDAFLDTDPMERARGITIFSKQAVLPLDGAELTLLDTPGHADFSSEMERTQSHAVFVFDEPTIGLHPLDVQTLLGVFRTLIDNGATVIVIEHDLDVIRSADYIVDMGPGGGEKGGRVVAAGTPAQIKATPESVTGRFL